jgi:Sigma-70 region 2
MSKAVADCAPKGGPSEKTSATVTDVSGTRCRRCLRNERLADMSEKANCERHAPGVKAKSLSVRVQSVLRPELPTGGGLTQVESEPKPQTAARSLQGTPRRPLPEIDRYLRRRTKSSDQAEELTQQVFADAALTLSRMDAGPGSMLGLLYTIARRHFADEARRHGRHGEHVPLEYVDEELRPPTTAATSPMRSGTRSRGSRPSRAELSASS